MSINEQLMWQCHFESRSPKMQSKIRSHNHASQIYLVLSWKVHVTKLPPTRKFMPIFLNVMKTLALWHKFFTKHTWGNKKIDSFEINQMAGCISWRNDPSRRCITKRKLCNFWKSRFAYATLKIIFAIWLLASVCSQYIRLCLVGDSVCSTFS